ncbi:MULTISPECIES: uracil phosphoribosyltransferase [Peptoniphilus]|jgi:uracil phosphoribosyltransferase|uniref:uracil phosphoribosyltransferase n=1 Tax=Peptoniphilus TaxID=162289 RepID=UPI0028FFA8E4|nr:MULTISPECIES: uracil phosphoribosyltransferase [Peptoniphilus]MBS6611114.1 uracil phosphoribosyltransferase [Peptoniphilus harei]MDU2109324.1 uracil phosphoribosyltransferase [Peptoniphilus lacydonensis]MDU3751126.1 uracil phosphoribosyltransferase [Peptoniphilus rhinitidis]MDU5377638.1 uracil phosphoribosyltransferase [Peptoniphilus lacydonensis]MDU5437490.1 uracil phosphoribosyltransferase [Peptoniphilus lacydonensis]
MAHTIIKHPLIDHKMTIIRKKETSSMEFRQVVNEISTLMGYEVTRDLETEDVEIETPIAKATGKMISGKKIGIVPILRAGLGMVEGLLTIVPAARVGHIGMYRDPETLKPVTYYSKLPKDISSRLMIIVDPMLATGGSLIEAIDELKRNGATNIKAINLLAAPEGLKAVEEAHPDVHIYIAALDEKLNEDGYIVPGLGDAGDRLFGTK